MVPIRRSFRTDRGRKPRGPPLRPGSPLEPATPAQALAIGKSSQLVRHACAVKSMAAQTRSAPLLLPYSGTGVQLLARRRIKLRISSAIFFGQNCNDVTNIFNSHGMAIVVKDAIAPIPVME